MVTTWLDPFKNRQIRLPFYKRDANSILEMTGKDEKVRWCENENHLMQFKDIIRTSTRSNEPIKMVEEYQVLNKVFNFKKKFWF